MGANASHIFVTNDFGQWHGFFLFVPSEHKRLAIEHIGRFVDLSWGNDSLFFFIFGFGLFFKLNQVIFELTVTTTIIIGLNTSGLFQLSINSFHLFHPLGLYGSFLLAQTSVFQVGAHQLTADSSVAFWCKLMNLFLLLLVVLELAGLFCHVAVKGVLQSVN